MNRFKVIRVKTTTFALALCLGLGGMTHSAFAKNSKLSPAKVKQIKKSNKSFNNCRKDALAALKDGAPKKKFEILLNTCEENFPGASLYIACKRDAVRLAAERKVEAAEAASQCQRYLLAASFDPALPFPFFAEKGQLYFAGIGLNKSVPVKSLQPPNFECEQVREATAKPKDAQYFLFGNHPRAFSTLTNKKDADLVSILEFKKVKKEGFDVPGFGKVFGDPTNEKSTVYFPASNCDFDGTLGDIYAGLSAYYLLDINSSVAVPYFGIVYYEPAQTKITTAELIQQTIKALTGGGGVPYKGFNKGGKSKNVTFIASRGFTEVDEERDPKNLCNVPRDQRFVGIVQAYEDKLTHPEYLLIANVSNLCSFGDKLARRLAE